MIFPTVIQNRADISSQTLNVNLSCPKYVLVYFKEFLVLKVKSLASSCGNLMENKRSHERALAVWLLSILQKLRRQHDLYLLFLILLICLKDHIIDAQFFLKNLQNHLVSRVVFMQIQLLGALGSFWESFWNLCDYLGFFGNLWDYFCLGYCM